MIDIITMHTYQRMSIYCLFTSAQKLNVLFDALVMSAFDSHIMQVGVLV